MRKHCGKICTNLSTGNYSYFVHTTAFGSCMYIWPPHNNPKRAKELPILEPMCNKLDKEWEELISGLKERDKILKEATSFWKARKRLFLLSVNLLTAHHIGPFQYIKICGSLIQLGYTVCVKSIYCI